MECTRVETSAIPLRGTGIGRYNVDDATMSVLPVHLRSGKESRLMKAIVGIFRRIEGLAV